MPPASLPEVAAPAGAFGADVLPSRPPTASSRAPACATGAPRPSHPIVRCLGQAGTALRGARGAETRGCAVGRVAVRGYEVRRGATRGCAMMRGAARGCEVRRCAEPWASAAGPLWRAWHISTRQPQFSAPLPSPGAPSPPPRAPFSGQRRGAAPPGAVRRLRCRERSEPFILPFPSTPLGFLRAFCFPPARSYVRQLLMGSREDHHAHTRTYIHTRTQHPPAAAPVNAPDTFYPGTRSTRQRTRNGRCERRPCWTGLRSPHTRLVAAAAPPSLPPAGRSVRPPPLPSSLPPFLRAMGSPRAPPPQHGR